MSVIDHRSFPRLGIEPEPSLPRMLRSEREAEVGAVAATPSRVMFHLQQVFRGFACGSLLVIPAVIWLSGALDARPGNQGVRPPAIVVAQVSARQTLPPEPASATASEATASMIVTTQARIEPPAPATAPAVPTVPATNPPTSVSAPIAMTPPPALQSTTPAPAVQTPAAPAAATVATAPEVSAESVVADLLEEARALVLAGRIVDARELLTQSEVRSSPEAKYVLAETYDPNVLAALSITQVKAEPMRARALYEQALGEGLTAARQRIRALE